VPARGKYRKKAADRAVEEVLGHDPLRLSASRQDCGTAELRAAAGLLAEHEERPFFK
jgi:hypothetical protein